jgi:hypothetical protein
VPLVVSHMSVRLTSAPGVGSLELHLLSIRRHSESARLFHRGGATTCSSDAEVTVPPGAMMQLFVENTGGFPAATSAYVAMTAQAQ